jgi:hypothetical protein
MAKTTKKPAEQDFFAVLGDTFKKIKESWEALLLNISTFLIIAIIPMVMVFVASIFFAGAVASSINGNSLVLGFSGAVAVVLILLAAVAGVIFLPAITITQLNSVRGKKIEVADAIKQGLPLVLPMLGLAILVGLSVVFGLILLIVPGLLAAFFFSMSLYIYVDNKPGVIESMKQSLELVKNNWMPVLAYFIVMIAVSIVSNFPGIGPLANFALSVAYFCLPAIIYVQISKN